MTAARQPGLTASRRPGAALGLAAALAGCLLGCGDGGPPLGPKGRGERFELLPAGPPLLVVAMGGRAPERVGVVVRSLPGREASPEGVEVRFRVLRGRSRLLQETALTDAGGLATVRFAPAPEPDSTWVRASVADDPRAALGIAVLARPALALEADSGSVVAVPGASRGVLLRIPAATTWELVPYVTSADHGRLQYAFRQDSVIRLSAAAPAAPAPPLAPAEGFAPPPPAGAGAAGAPVLQSAVPGLPAAFDVFNCRLQVHRAAPLVYAGSAIALYVDGPEPPQPGLVEEIGRAFDEQVAPRVSALFGEPLDLDRNGRVLAVLSPAMPQGGVYCDSLRRLRREVVYAAWSPDRPPAEALELLAHEYQHVINASQHLRFGPPDESADVAWLNEGFSHVAEWAAGFPADDLIRTFSFLTRLNGSWPLLGRRYHPDFLAGWFLFALYLGDRFGEGVYRALGESGLTGRQNVARVTGVSVRDLLRDWFVTLALSDGPPREELAWSYRSIRLAGEEERAATCGCLPAPRLPGPGFEEHSLDGDLALLRTLDVQDADFFRFTAGAHSGVLYFHAGGEPDVELFAVRRR